MFPRKIICILVFLFYMVPCVKTLSECRHLDFKPELAFEGKRLLNHIINTVQVVDSENCGFLCFTEPNCVSYNLKASPTSNGYHECELNNSTSEVHENEMEFDPDYVYRGVKSACVANPCMNNGTCQTGFTEKGRRCSCPVGFNGENCENDVDECATGGNICTEYETCNNTVGSYNCIPLPGIKMLQEGNLSAVIAIFGSGKKQRSLVNETVLGACSGGVWKLVMKMDGKKLNFRYDSPLWKNKESFNLGGGETGFDNIETKLPTYWSSSFTKICLGMKFHNEENAQFIVINKTAGSLYSLIADGQYRPTSVGRNKWKSLIGSEASLQANCNKEGFNVKGGPNQVRIGILGNEQPDCDTCDSKLGFGGNGSLTCGNLAVGRVGADNGDKLFKVMGYILIQ